MAAKVGASYAGPTLLHVGERSPKDKNYETSEVVLAAPGTVVAPIPKGMDVTPENAIGLLLAQLLKSKGAKPKKGAQGAQGGYAAPTSSGQKTMGQQFSMQDFLGLLGAGNQLGANQAEWKLGNRNADITQETARKNYDLARSKATSDADLGRMDRQQRAYEFNAQWGKQNSADLYNQGQDYLNRQTSYNNSYNQNAADNAWRYAQIQAQRDIAAQQDATRRLEAQNQNSYWQGQLGNQQQEDAFNQLIRGISESLLPGRGRGTMPSSGV